MGFPTSHSSRFYAALNFLKMGIKMPRFVVFWTTSTLKDEKSAAKFHYIKTLSGKVVAQSIAFRVVQIYWHGVAPFSWYLHTKGPTPPHWKPCVAHTSPHSSSPLASVACVRLNGWPVISSVGSVTGSIVKPMFTQFDCQSNSSTNCRINSWTECSSNC